MPAQGDQRQPGEAAGSRGDEEAQEPDAGTNDSATAPPEQRDDDLGAESEPAPEGIESDADAEARQQAADEAQQDAMQRALEAGADGQPQPASAQGETRPGDEREQANAAWLRRVPDDPGALLRARFRNEHLRRRAEER